FVPALDVNVTYPRFNGEQAIRKHAHRVTGHLAEFVGARGAAQPPQKAERNQHPLCFPDHLPTDPRPRLPVASQARIESFYCQPAAGAILNFEFWQRPRFPRRRGRPRARPLRGAPTSIRAAETEALRIPNMN